MTKRIAKSHQKKTMHLKFNIIVKDEILCQLAVLKYSPRLAMWHLRLTVALEAGFQPYRKQTSYVVESKLPHMGREMKKPRTKFARTK